MKALKKVALNFISLIVFIFGFFISFMLQIYIQNNGWYNIIVDYKYPYAALFLLQIVLLIITIMTTLAIIRITSSEKNKIIGCLTLFIGLFIILFDRKINPFNSAFDLSISDFSDYEDPVPLAFIGMYFFHFFYFFLILSEYIVINIIRKIRNKYKHKKVQATSKQRKIITVTLMSVMIVCFIWNLIFLLAYNNSDIAKLIQSNSIMNSLENDYRCGLPALLSIPIAAVNVFYSINDLYLIYKSKKEAIKKLRFQLVYSIVSLSILVLHCVTLNSIIIKNFIKLNK
ncbi:MAG: hypothetical protein IKI94_10495 [Ruminococcus sp.]|nr:hypothetical protein [Ruminococcus sp.]